MRLFLLEDLGCSKFSSVDDAAVVEAVEELGEGVPQACSLRGKGRIPSVEGSEEG